MEHYVSQVQCLYTDKTPMCIYCTILKDIGMIRQY